MGVKKKGQLIYDLFYYLVKEIKYFYTYIGIYGGT